MNNMNSMNNNRKSYNSSNVKYNGNNVGNRQHYGRNNNVQKNINHVNNPSNNQKKSNGIPGNMYGNICNTMQKKFNLALYKDGQNKNGNSENNKGNLNNGRSKNMSNGINGKNYGSKEMRRMEIHQGKRINVAQNNSSLNKNKSSNERVNFNRNFDKANMVKINNKKESEAVVKGYTEESNLNAKYQDEVSEVLPKSVFIYITVAVIFVAALILTISNKENVEKKLVDISTTTSKEKAVNDYDDVLDLEDNGEVDANQEDDELGELELLEDSEEEDERAQMLASIAATQDEESVYVNNTSQKTNQSTSNTNTKTSNTTPSNTTPSNTTTSNNTTNTNNSTNTTVNNNNTSNNGNNTTIDNSSNNNQESTKEEEKKDEAVEMSYMYMSLTGKLWHCTGMYGVFGAESSFVKCSDTYYVEGDYTVMVPKKDINGIWLDVKGTQVNDYIGYKDGVKTKVVRIRLEEANSTVYKDIYAIKGTFINLGGSYKSKSQSSTFSSMFATEDMELVKVG